jgi:tetratricopeptide (TPR) repeat protein
LTEQGRRIRESALGEQGKGSMRREMESRTYRPAADFDDQKIREALEILTSAESRRPLTARELCEKGNLLCAHPDPGDDTLGLAKQAYQESLRVDDNYVPALIGLAWFQYSMGDEAGAAVPLFRKAIALCSEDLNDALKGLTGCFEELAALREMEPKRSSSRWTF